jgi:hypothetical protein
LFPGSLWVNSNIAFCTQFFGENFISFDTDIGSLPINRFFLTGQTDSQTAKPQSARLRDEHSVFAAWMERVVADFDDRRPDPG